METDENGSLYSSLSLERAMQELHFLTEMDGFEIQRISTLGSVEIFCFCLRKMTGDLDRIQYTIIWYRLRFKDSLSAPIFLLILFVLPSSPISFRINPG